MDPANSGTTTGGGAWAATPAQGLAGEFIKFHVAAGRPTWVDAAAQGLHGNPAYPDTATGVITAPEFIEVALVGVVAFGDWTHQFM